MVVTRVRARRSADRDDRSGVAIVAHAGAVRKSGAERGDRRDAVALGQAHHDDAAGLEE